MKCNTLYGYLRKFVAFNLLNGLKYSAAMQSNLYIYIQYN